MSQSTRSIIVCHVTPRRNLPSIWRNGLLPHFCSKASVPVGCSGILCCAGAGHRSMSLRSKCHQRHHRLRLHTDPGPRPSCCFRRGIWHSAQPVPSSCIISVSLPSPAVSAGEFPSRLRPLGGGALEHHHMCNRKCQVWLEITKADGTANCATA